jgi:hypothetical protein
MMDEMALRQKEKFFVKIFLTDLDVSSATSSKFLKMVHPK